MGRIFLVAILVVIGLGVFALFALSQTTSSAESIANSAAEIEAARAMQMQAAATQDAVSALGAVTVMDKLLGILLVVLLLALVGLAFYAYRQNMKMRQMQLALLAQENKPKWAPGPNAGWRKLGDAPAPAVLPQPAAADSGLPTMQEMMSMMSMSVMAMMAKALGGQMVVPQTPSPALLAQSHQAAPQAASYYDDGPDYIDLNLEPQGNDFPHNVWEEMFQ